MCELNYAVGTNSVPTLRMSEAWKQQVMHADTLPAVLLQLAVLESCLDQGSLKRLGVHRRQEASDKRRMEMRQRQADRDLRQVTNCLDRIIAQIERQHNKGARASERQSRRSEKRSKRSEITYDYLGFDQLKDNMYCECLWDGEDDEEVWYRAFVRTKTDTGAMLFYPDSGEEETMTRQDVSPGSVRCLGAEFTPPVAPWIEAESTVDEGALAIKGLPIPEREPLESPTHESMYTVWESIRYIADGYGRPRAMKFLKNISKQEYPDYYDMIEKPKCLESIRKKIENKGYKTMDAFEEDMTLIFENNREYFDPESQQYADAEVLQSIFWEALGAVESGRAFVLTETDGEFSKPKKRSHSAKQKLPSGSPRATVSKLDDLPVPEGVDPAMFKMWHLVKNKKDKNHRSRSAAFLKLPTKEQWPDYYDKITTPIDLPTVYDRLIAKKYEAWQAFEDDMQLMFSNARVYNKPGSEVYDDATVLDTLVRRCRPGEEKARRKEEEKQEAARRREMSKAEKRQLREVEKEVRNEERKRRGLEVREEVKLPPQSEQQHMVFDTVCKLKDGDRQRADLFFALPDRTVLPGLPPFPPISETPPVGLAYGRADKLVDGVLPDLAKTLPTEAELAQWSKASQLAFWEQRRLFWGRSKWKMTELQRECRKRDIWPGGDLPDVRHRLIRCDCCRSELLSCETKTEAMSVEEDADIGVIYYKIVKDPIDLNAIRENIDAEKYKNMAAMERDLTKLFNNARKFDAYVNEKEERFVSKDADTLQAMMNRRIKEVAEKMKQLAQGKPKRIRNRTTKITFGSGATGEQFGPPSDSPAAASAGGPSKPRQRKPSAAAGSKKQADTAAKATAKLTARIATAFKATVSAKDGKRKRAGLFMELPDRDDYPDYYELIAEPQDLDTIEARVKTGGFKTWNEFEEEMMKVFANAKQYNADGSEVYEDAEAMQGILEALAQVSDDEEAEDESEEEDSEDESEEESEEDGSEEEESEEEESESEEEEEEESEEAEAPSAKKKPKSMASPKKRSPAAAVKKKETPKELQARVGAAFHLIKNCKDGRRKRATLFMELPGCEDYPDYFLLIKAPIDLDTIGARIKAGKYKKWELFEAEMGRVFSNAQQYNHEDSEIYEDAEAMQQLLEELTSEGEEDEDESEDDEEEEEEEEEESEEDEEESEEESEKEEDEEEPFEAAAAKKQKGRKSGAAAAANGGRKRGSSASSPREAAAAKKARGSGGASAGKGSASKGGGSKRAAPQSPPEPQLSPVERSKLMLAALYVPPPSSFHLRLLSRIMAHD